MKLNVLIGAIALAGGVGVAAAEEAPRVVHNGAAVQLMVDGAPYLVLGGELHNSSPSSPEYMAPIWDRLAANHVRTVIGSASWELVEPEEGRFDFTAVDDQIRQARAHGMRLVLIWFGAYKNAESTYAPSWVRQDKTRFPRAARDPNSQLHGRFSTRPPILSVFNDRLVEADARAFAALMRHIRDVDARRRTVIMIQVENEVGLLGDSRDRSALADVKWAQQAPAELMSYLRTHRAALRPWLAELWARQGFRESGTWAEVFGADGSAEEVFMAWGFGRYVEQVAAAGASVYPLPMYTNAWLGPQPNAPLAGQYPSGGPVSRLMDVWKAAAPSLALLAPDIYVDDFSGTLEEFHAQDNPIFVPEARLDAANLFIALGQYDAIGFSPFGVESGSDDHPLFKAYRILNEMTAIIARAQSDGRIRGFSTASGASQETLAGYQINISRPRSTLGAFGAGTGSAEAAPAPGYGLIINTAPDEFLVVGQNISVDFTVANRQVEMDSVVEGRFENGRWVSGRTLNGDERYSLFPQDDLRVVTVRLLQR